MDLNLRGSSGRGGDSYWSATGPKTDWQVSTPKEGLNGGSSDKPFSPDGGNLVKLVILGAPGVGKTSIIQQFVWGNFESSYFPTSRKETYYPSVILHDRHYQLKIVDIPDLPFFPVNSFYNLSDLQVYGLRDATAYVLIFDLLSTESFEYITNLFNQISESRDLERVPMIIIGNKTDKVDFTTSRQREKKASRHHHRDDFHHHDPHHQGFGDPHGYHGWGFSSHHHNYDSFGSKNKRSSKSRYSSSSSSSPPAPHRKVDVWGKDAFLDRDRAEMVTQEWHATYRECSARDPESVTDVFKAIMEVVEEQVEEDELEGKFSKKCVIL